MNPDFEKEQALKEETPELQSEEVQDQAPEIDEHSQAMMKLVEEVVDLFKPRIASGELTPYEVAEALAVSLTGTIYSIVPPEKQKTIQREAESITRKMLKAFDRQVQKKDSMFASQMLAAAKSSSYVVSHGNRILSDFRKEAAKEAEAKIDELAK